MKLYRFLLHFYPARFREEYARQIELGFRDDLHDAPTPRARAGVWTKALTDLAVSIPSEMAREGGRDLRHALRMYSKRKLVTASAVVALALAIGAATGVFSVVNAVLLRELPFFEPDRLVYIRGGNLGSFGSKAKFEERRKQAQEYLEDGALYTSNLLNLDRAGTPYRVRVTETSANFFSVLGVEPSLGRSFLPDEDSPDRNQVAVLSQSLWRQNFGADASILGSRVTINGTPFTVVGIAPTLFDYPDKSDVWTPSGLDMTRIPKGALFLQAFGRLKAAMTLSEARARFETIVRRNNPDAFNLPPALRENNLPALTPLRDQLARGIRGATLVLLATTVFVLLIACANIAQLLLARLNERRQEFEVRTALGASRARLMQQLVVEAMALTSVACLAGLAMARWTAQLMALFAPSALDAQAYTILDPRVLGFSVALAVAAGLLFGVLPALGLAKPRNTRSGQSFIRTGLVVVQGALTLVLLAGTFTMSRGFLAMLDADLGIEPQNVVALTASLEGTRVAKSPALYYQQVIERLKAVPGVEDAGAMMNLPFQKYSIVSGANLVLETGEKVPGFVAWNAVSPRLFATLRQQLVAGRDFTPAERAGKELAMIVNEEAARATGLGPAIVGHRTAKGQYAQPPATIVGVVRTASANGPAVKQQAALYRPIESSAATWTTFAVRVRGDASQMIPALRAAARTVDPSVPIHDVKLMDDLLNDLMARPRFYTYSMAALGGFALLLAVLGIYGIASHSIAQRTKEIGIRIAIGATPESVRRMGLRQGLLPLIAGLILGVGGTLLLGKYVESLMDRAEPPGPMLTAGAVLFLLAACSAAVWRATDRVVKIDPVQALRVD